MRTTFALHRSLKLNLVAISYTLGLALTSCFIWTSSLDRVSGSLSAGLRLTALALVVAWTHFLVWLFRRMLHGVISNGYCAVLFFGAWTLFFLVYNCLM
jgi:hypothetical protein